MGRKNSRSSPKPNPEHSEECTLRIIGGEWRRRKLNFPQSEGLRPTPDRVRETLFNWLQAITPGARCLDLYSGSGALALEALSRGASMATLIDQSAAVCHGLRTNLNLLKAQNAEVIHSDALSWAERQDADLGERFDLVFLDPPFRRDLIPAIALILTQRNLLADDARIYVESEVELGMPRVPESWHLIREKIAGQVAYRLFTFEPVTSI